MISTYRLDSTSYTQWELRIKRIPLNPNDMELPTIVNFRRGDKAFQTIISQVSSLRNLLSIRVYQYCYRSNMAHCNASCCLGVTAGRLHHHLAILPSAPIINLTATRHNVYSTQGSFTPQSLRLVCFWWSHAEEIRHARLDMYVHVEGEVRFRAHGVVHRYSLLSLRGG